MQHRPSSSAPTCSGRPRPDPAARAPGCRPRPARPARRRCCRAARAGRRRSVDEHRASDAAGSAPGRGRRDRRRVESDAPRTAVDDASRDAAAHVPETDDADRRHEERRTPRPVELAVERREPVHHERVVAGHRGQRRARPRAGVPRRSRRPSRRGRRRSRTATRARAPRSSAPRPRRAAPGRLARRPPARAVRASDRRRRRTRRLRATGPDPVSTRTRPSSRARSRCSISVGLDVERRARARPLRAAPELELALVHDELRIRERAQVADVVVVEVRDDDLGDRLRRDAEPRQRLDRRRQARAPAALADGAVEAGVDEHRALAVPAQHVEEVVHAERCVGLAEGLEAVVGTRSCRRAASRSGRRRRPRLGRPRQLMPP